jgi:hypothetical protein
MDVAGGGARLLLLPILLIIVKRCGFARDGSHLILSLEAFFINYLNVFSLVGIL